ncbi:MAG TPA: heme exporter protein CcmD [Xanthomonadaceae bacterium]|jgi:hypothetical protein|nr:heme exporter protein CcmD [Xanthomonadaceae bacterium]
MQHLHVWFVAGAYATFALILLADLFLPRIKLRSLLRGILLRERRASAPTRPVSADHRTP